jgi:hypothetical protein
MPSNSNASYCPISTELQDWDVANYPHVFPCHARHDMLHHCVLPSPYRALLLSYPGLKELIIENSWYAALPCICVQNPKLLNRSNMLLSSAENCSVLLKLRMSKTDRDWFISSALHTLHLTTTRRSKGMVLIRFIMYGYGRFRH